MILHYYSKSIGRLKTPWSEAKYFLISKRFDHIEMIALATNCESYTVIISVITIVW